MVSATQYRPLAVVLLAAFLLLASPVAMRGAAAANGGNATACGHEKFPVGKTYENCTALGHLGATLYWTYDAKSGALSVAFVAKPGGAGWVAWAINPTGDGMKGAQALVAFKAAGPASSYVVRTYNVTGYRPFPANSTRIAYNATDLAADESNGEVRLYGKLQLAAGMTAVNHIWQAGNNVTDGVPAKHAFDKENLDAKGRLALVGSAADAPAPAPATPGSSSSAKAATAGTFSAPVLAVLALVGFLATV
jgi:hypothetical protein